MDRHILGAAQARIVIVHPIGKTDVPACLELDVLYPGLWLVDPQDLVGVGRDG